MKTVGSLRGFTSPEVLHLEQFRAHLWTASTSFVGFVGAEMFYLLLLLLLLFDLYLVTHLEIKLITVIIVAIEML